MHMSSGGVGSEGRGSGGGVSGVVDSKAESEVECLDWVCCGGSDSNRGCGKGGIDGISCELDGYISSKCVSPEGDGITDGALLSARDVGEGGSSVTSLKPSRYIEIASSTLIPPSMSGASGVSGDRSVIELLFVRTLLRSVPLCCSMLDLDVIAELKLDLRGLSSTSPFGGKRGKGRPCRLNS